MCGRLLLVGHAEYNFIHDNIRHTIGIAYIIMVIYLFLNLLYFIMVIYLLLNYFTFFLNLLHNFDL